MFGNLNPPTETVEAIVDSVRAGTNNGYAPSTGKNTKEHYNF